MDDPFYRPTREELERYRILPPLGDPAEEAPEQATPPGGPGAPGGPPRGGELPRELPEGAATERARYVSDTGALFGLALGGVLLTIFTLGIYRFWMRTRLRRYYWSAIRLGGDPLEYSGTGLEKLLGFLLAIVVLAIYLGLINLGLTFAGISLVSEMEVQTTIALNISILATVPLLFYATYRAQRYRLARTRWRGIRLGLMPGAWSYTWRAVLLTLLSIATLGLAYPYQHFTLARFVTDRAWFGDLPFRQGGGWWPLFTYWIWIYVFIGFGALLIWGAMADPTDPMAAMLAAIFAITAYLGLFALFTRYRVAAIRILWSQRSLGTARFRNTLRTAPILRIYLFGSIGVGILAILVGAAVGAAAFFLVGDLDEWRRWMEQLSANQTGPGGEPSVADLPIPLLGVMLATYLAIFVTALALGHVLITQPELRRQVEATTVQGFEQIAQSRQRPHDKATEAGGFADALDVDLGAGI